jgi:hypothetical protein
LTRRLNIWLLSVLLIIGIPYYWYLIDPGFDADAGKANAEPVARPVTIAQLRALAAGAEGARPAELRVETVGYRYISRNMIVAGSGLRATPTEVRAYELMVPGGAPLVIDAGTTAKVARAHDFDSYDQQAQARIDRALGRAAHALLLSDRPIHNGGHVSGTRRPGGEMPPGGTAPYAPAPGVVVIPVPGLGSRSAMVYVWMANDREYLFTGDVARLAASWRRQRLPARLATRGEKAGYRRENLSWLMTINALHRAAPQMVIVSGHEPGKVPFSAGTFSD